MRSVCLFTAHGLIEKDEADTEAIINVTHSRDNARSPSVWQEMLFNNEDRGWSIIYSFFYSLLCSVASLSYCCVFCVCVCVCVGGVGVSAVTSPWNQKMPFGRDSCLFTTIKDMKLTNLKLTCKGICIMQNWISLNTCINLNCKKQWWGCLHAVIGILWFAFLRRDLSFMCVYNKLHI